MKRTLCASVLALLILMTGVAAAQDLGNVARQQRQQKKPSAKKVYTNDDIASQPMPAAETAAAVDAKAAPADAKTEKPKEAAVDEKAKATASLQQKVDAQKAEIATLQREFDIANRENKLRVANYYADAGNSLRDPKKFQDEQRTTLEEISSKQKAIDAAKIKLADIVEQGRKSGIKVNE